MPSVKHTNKESDIQKVCDESQIKKKSRVEIFKERRQIFRSQKKILRRSCITVENTVFNFSFKDSMMSIANVSKFVPGTKHKRKSFSSGVIKLVSSAQRASVIAISMFKSGVVITGPKSDEDANLAVCKFVKLLNAHLPENQVLEKPILCLRNIVVTARLGVKVDLDKFYRENPAICKFDKKIFSGVITKLPGRNQKSLTFGMGYVNVTGSDSVESAYNFLDELLVYLAPCCLCKPEDIPIEILYL